MTTKRICCISALALFWASLARLSLAVPSPQQAGEAAAQPALVQIGSQQASPPPVAKDRGYGDLRPVRESVRGIRTERAERNSRSAWR
jgi:hypothetical protein